MGEKKEREGGREREREKEGGREREKEGGRGGEENNHCDLYLLLIPCKYYIPSTG